MIFKVVDGKQTPLIRAYLPPSTMEDLPESAEALTRFRNQNTKALGDPNTDIQSQNPRSQQVTKILMEFRLVEYRHHINSAGGPNTGNVVLEAGQNIFGRKVGRRKHGRKKAW